MVWRNRRVTGDTRTGAAMRIALLSDIHGNLVALDAALAELASEPLDQLICLGDVATDGPRPREVLGWLRERAALVVMGNADHYLLEPAGIESTRWVAACVL